MVGSVNNGVQSAYANAYQKRAEDPAKREDTRKTESENATASFDIKERDEKTQVRAANDTNSDQDERRSASRRGSLVDVTV